MWAADPRSTSYWKEGQSQQQGSRWGTPTYCRLAYLGGFNQSASTTHSKLRWEFCPTFATESRWQRSRKQAGKPSQPETSHFLCKGSNNGHIGRTNCFWLGLDTSWLSGTTPVNARADRVDSLACGLSACPKGRVRKEASAF